MNINEEFKKELLARGFTVDANGLWMSPYNGVVLSDGYATPDDLIELLDDIAARTVFSILRGHGPRSCTTSSRRGRDNHRCDQSSDRTVACVSRCLQLDA